MADEGEKRVYTEEALRAAVLSAWRAGFTEARGGQLSPLGQRTRDQRAPMEAARIAEAAQPIHDQDWAAVPVLARMLSRWTERQPRILRSALAGWRDQLRSALEELPGDDEDDVTVARLEALRGQVDAVLAIESDVFVIGSAGPDA